MSLQELQYLVNTYTVRVFMLVAWLSLKQEHCRVEVLQLLTTDVNLSEDRLLSCYMVQGFYYFQEQRLQINVFQTNAIFKSLLKFKHLLRKEILLWNNRRQELLHRGLYQSFMDRSSLVKLVEKINQETNLLNRKWPSMDLFRIISYKGNTLGQTLSLFKLPYLH